MRVTVRRGLDIPVPGTPRQAIEDGPPVTSVALLGDDHPLRRPRVQVAVGERVRRGQVLVTDRAAEEFVLTAPATGVVERIERGERRSLRAVVIGLQEGIDDGREPGPSRTGDEIGGLPRSTVVQSLIDGGLWPALRTRPFHRVPASTASPHSIFVTAIDTEPLAPRPDVVLAAHPQDFADGLVGLSRLTEGLVHVCTEPGRAMPFDEHLRIRHVEFAGPHPAGLVGTHIHLLDPVVGSNVVWHVGYQDVISIGRLLTSGTPWDERIVALAGPAVKRPRLLRTRLGARIDDLVRDELREGDCRVLSGSVLSGRQASGWGRHLGRFHRQVCALPEPRAGSADAASTTAIHGHPGPMLPTEDFERVLPLDLLPVPLLRALLVGDDERAEALGCLELDEEDLALCTYVCPAKQEYGPLLTRALRRIEEGR